MNKPLIVQSDNTLLLEVDNDLHEDARDAIAPFAELEKSPEHIHTYRITALSLWNAASSGLDVDQVIERLNRYTRYEIPQTVRATINEQMQRYGMLKLYREDDSLVLYSSDPILLREIIHQRTIEKYLVSSRDDHSVLVDPALRGHIKQSLIKLGFPVEDLAGYEEGDPCHFSLREETGQGREFVIRDYQKSAVTAFHRGGGPEGGNGVIVLPCGAGKTIVGIGVMDILQAETLILVTNTVALRQWKEELLDKTTLTEDQIGEYSGDTKEIKPVTVATYSILTYRKKKNEPFKHFEVFTSKNWGLIIYDEVHLLPAPVFRMTSEIQSKRRLGLTATLIREDGLETDVFSLIGPKKFDMPWKILEESNWIAQAMCSEVRILLPDEEKYRYSTAGDREKFRIASENQRKMEYIQHLLDYHEGARILIIGQYIDQLKTLAEKFRYPLITGSTPVTERESLYAQFRTGEVDVLIVSKVANFSIDLPDANVAIQVSGTFGSRQEEAQRLGRILRPKQGENRAFFYTLITSNSVEEQFAHNRQLFLTEQGYTYIILNEEMFHEQFKNNQGPAC